MGVLIYKTKIEGQVLLKSCRYNKYREQEQGKAATRPNIKQTAGKLREQGSLLPQSTEANESHASYAQASGISLKQNRQPDRQTARQTDRQNEINNERKEE